MSMSVCACVSIRKCPLMQVCTPVSLCKGWVGAGAPAYHSNCATLRLLCLQRMATPHVCMSRECVPALPALPHPPTCGPRLLEVCAHARTHTHTRTHTHMWWVGKCIVHAAPGTLPSVCAPSYPLPSVCAPSYHTCTPRFLCTAQLSAACALPCHFCHCPDTHAPLFCHAYPTVCHADPIVCDTHHHLPRAPQLPAAHAVPPSAALNVNVCVCVCVCGCGCGSCPTGATPRMASPLTSPTSGTAATQATRRVLN